jgi:hypothetical protein
MTARTPVADVRDEHRGQVRPDLINFCFWDVAAVTRQASQSDETDANGPNRNRPQRWAMSEAEGIPDVLPQQARCSLLTPTGPEQVQYRGSRQQPLRSSSRLGHHSYLMVGDLTNSLTGHALRQALSVVSRLVTSTHFWAQICFRCDSRKDDVVREMAISCRYQDGNTH